ncbi:MAG: hypothetical protein Q8Q12_10295 [bacterium]|nr:hypothetical protein [bacterium]
MNGYDWEQRAKWRFPFRAACTFLSFLILMCLVNGCVVNDISVVSYRSSAEVKPAETLSRPVVGSSPFPWDIVLAGVSDIFTGARKKAIEEKVGYRESRSFTLFRLKKADSQSLPCSEKADPGNQTPSREQEE